MLRKGMPREKREQTYLHELVHGILDQLGYLELYEDEHLVQFWSSVILTGNQT